MIRFCLSPVASGADSLDLMALGRLINRLLLTSMVKEPSQSSMVRVWNLSNRVFMPEIYQLPPGQLANKDHLRESEGDRNMTKELKAERYAELPEHPMEPFLRIIGVALARPKKPGRRCPWGLAFAPTCSVMLPIQIFKYLMDTACL